MDTHKRKRRLHRESRDTEGMADSLPPPNKDKIHDSRFIMIQNARVNNARSRSLSHDDKAITHTEHWSGCERALEAWQGIL